MHRKGESHHYVIGRLGLCEPPKPLTGEALPYDSGAVSGPMKGTAPLDRAGDKS